jgi:hypothetical protein
VDIEKLLVRVSRGAFGDDVEPDFTLLGPAGPEDDRFRQLKTMDDWKVRPLRSASPRAEWREAARTAETASQTDTILSLGTPYVLFTNPKQSCTLHLRRFVCYLVVDNVATALFQPGIELMERT